MCSKCKVDPAVSILSRRPARPLSCRDLCDLVAQLLLEASPSHHKQTAIAELERRHLCRHLSLAFRLVPFPFVGRIGEAECARVTKRDGCDRSWFQAVLFVGVCRYFVAVVAVCGPQSEHEIPGVGVA